ncbi:MAG: ATP-binding cassette domain-containing protein, partial [Tissierellia bacterium]|nr:ATP-binding cassette domain-containing protein [Tissierellia bacterium]
MIIRTEDLSVYYGYKNILKDVNVTFEKNKITAIIGPSGCGKTTFLKSLNRTIEEYGGKTEGNIYLNNEDIMNIPVQKLRNRIGMVFQTPVV